MLMPMDCMMLPHAKSDLLCCTCALHSEAKTHLVDLWTTYMNNIGTNSQQIELMENEP